MVLATPKRMPRKPEGRRNLDVGGLNSAAWHRCEAATLSLQAGAPVRVGGHERRGFKTRAKAYVYKKAGTTIAGGARRIPKPGLEAVGDGVQGGRDRGLQELEGHDHQDGDKG